jgi:5-methyltetrahydrofolate--homocysteine methyltransferase
MKKFLERINNNELLIADGAIGTMLISKGLKPGDCPEEMNLSNSNALEEIAMEYLNVGAEILQTNTFGGSPLKLVDYALDNKTEEINKAAINSVKKIAAGKAYVSASCGPSGKILKPYGDLEPEKLSESFERQMAVLKDADIICIETMTDLEEIAIAIKAAKKAAGSIPIMATLTFDNTPRGFFTVMGVTIEAACKRLENEGVDLIGSNCGNGIENMIKIAKEFKKHTKLPLIIQSFMAEKAKVLRDIGVSVIGGCCGTTPKHIEYIKNIIGSC